MYKIKRTCKLCKKEFEVSNRVGLNWIEKSGRYKYCSRDCANKSKKGKHFSKDTEFTKDTVAWDKHPRFKTGKWTYRRFLRSSCEQCSSEDNLFIHHVDENRENNKIDNLMTVCAKCHTSVFHPRKFYGNQYVEVRHV